MNRSVVFIEDTSSLELQMRRKSGKDVGEIHYVEVLSECLFFFGNDCFYLAFSFFGATFLCSRTSVLSEKIPSFRV